ncbi:Crp/Fnr family transcriptional regulator [Ralstonia solanacearum]|uniref:Crp/Fnr family transcriptional regulator n=1 Tax=Ralstonia solanacearum TaxID=305 RepID=UPI0005C656FA|nr:Crp/Fnr family transcriptional regulator [Ralstonia solanacearum]AST34712.2 Crp/Fnr family transcriptional regulator [Ralstonia solanacearum]AYB53988.1 Crp/Fnr family transcriptional regulator [Ralstonia solanacearum]AYB58537.1 Crp/Fnr family transcriptional regulator [Ralstonia solanacearum]MBB6592998.1 Crp/Fnr family transcriptional regulator [Ralstonia solanacearum]MBB6597225.1 Crp/Fnr family transcriptional regulator [Ralstonia solanacearum]
MDSAPSSPALPGAQAHRERLYASSWFGALGTPLQDALIDMAVVRRLGSGEALFRRGDPSDGLYCVVDGAIRVGATRADGRESLLAVLEPVNWFGEIGVFDRQARTHDAHADGDTLLLHMPQPPLAALLDRSPESLRAIALLLTHKLRLTFTVLEETTLLPAAERVARRLLLMADGYGDLRLGTRRVLRVPQEQLAQLLALSRQTVNQVLKDFETRGLLRLAYGEIELLDFAGLRALARG